MDSSQNEGINKRSRSPFSRSRSPSSSPSPSPHGPVSSSLTPGPTVKIHQRSQSLNVPTSLLAPKSLSASSVKVNDASPELLGITPSVIDGYLLLAGPKGKSWNRTWFSVKNTVILFGPQKTEIDGVVDLSIITEALEGPTISRTNQCIFILTTPYREFYLSTTTLEERAKWLKTITETRSLLPNLETKLVTSSDISTDIYREGILWKSKKVTATNPSKWQKLFVVQNGDLIYFCPGKGDPPHSHLLLQNVRGVHLGNPKDKKKTFTVDLETDSWLFHCKTDQERAEWISALNAKNPNASVSVAGDPTANEEAGLKKREEEEKKWLEELVVSENELEEKGFLNLAGTSSLEQIGQVTFDISIIEFFGLFHSSTSSSFLTSFKTKRGDYELEAGSWEPNAEFGMTREISYRSPIKGAFIGPKSTKVIEFCRYHLTKQKLIIETRGQMPDLPIHVRVETKWEITETGPYSCSCAQYIGTEAKSALLKGKIQSTTVAEGKESFSLWKECAMKEVRAYRERIYGTTALENDEKNSEELDEGTLTKPENSLYSWKNLRSNPFFFSTLFLAALCILLFACLVAQLL